MASCLRAPSFPARGSCPLHLHRLQRRPAALRGPPPCAAAGAAADAAPPVSDRSAELARIFSWPDSDSDPRLAAAPGTCVILDGANLCWAYGAVSGFHTPTARCPPGPERGR